MSSVTVRPPTTKVARLFCLDAMRGLAIVLMVLDHACALVLSRLDDGPFVTVAGGLRITVTRASLPLFMLCTGALLARKAPSWRRLGSVAAAAVVINVALCCINVGIGVPEILFVWVLVMLGASFIRRYPVTIAALGIVQATTWPIAWGGYQPGTVAALIALGSIVGVHAFWPWVKLPSWMQTVGRRPLRWYCCHLAVLGAIALVWPA